MEEQIEQAESERAYCENGHELWVQLGPSGEVIAAKDAIGQRFVFIDASFCPVCGADIAAPLTEERVRATLARAAPGADELLRQLNDDALHVDLSLRLDASGRSR